MTIYEWGEGGMVGANVFNYVVKLEPTSALDITSLKANIAETPAERSFNLLYDETCSSSLVSLGNGFYALTTFC